MTSVSMRQIYKPLVLSILFIALLTSCNGQLREEKYPNGSLKRQYSVIKTKSGNFLKSGKYKEWFPDGQPSMAGTYSDGNRTGVWQTWYRNGQKQSDANFKNDTLSGVFVSYFENGNKESQGSFNRGKEMGPWSVWNQSGKVIGRANFNQKGKLEGLQESWDDLGNKEREENYVSGLREGICKQWNNGNLVMNALFNKGSLAGLPATFRTKKGEVLEFVSPTEYRAKVTYLVGISERQWKEIAGTYYFRNWSKYESPAISFGNEYLYELKIYKITSDTINADGFVFIRQGKQ